MYNNAYGQQAPQLPFPTDTFLAPIIPVIQGQPPILPQIPNIPPELSQYYPLIVSDCITALQAKAANNPLRVFLYNQMSYGGYNNNEFARFVVSVVQLIEMNLGLRRFNDVQTASRVCAEQYAELNTAVNTVMYPALMGAINQSLYPHVQSALADFDRLSQEMNAFNQMKAQQQQYGQMQRPMQQPMPQAYGQPYGQPAYDPRYNQPAYGQQYGQPQQPAMNPYQNQMNAARPGYNRWNNAPKTQMDALSAGAVSVGQSNPISTVAGYTQMSNAQPSTDPIAQRYENAERMRQSNSFQQAEPVQRVVQQPAQQPVFSAHVENIKSLWKQAEKTQTAQPAPQEEAAPIYKAEECPFPWHASEEYPVAPAYDPNTSELYYQVFAPNKIKPLIKKKDITMNRDQHLAVPSFAKIPPAGINALDSETRIRETMEAVDARAEKDAEAKPLNVAYKDDSFYSDVSLRQLWFDNEIGLATMKKATGKTNMFRTCAVVLDPLVCTENPKPMIDSFAQCVTFDELASKMNAFSESIAVAYRGKPESIANMVKALGFVNKRLTDCANHFVRYNLAAGLSIESFITDGADLIPYILKKYGKKFCEAIQDHQATIIKQALTYGDAEFERDQNTNLFTCDPEEVPKLLGDVNVTYFYDYHTLTSLELYSTELKAETPKVSNVSVGIFSTQTPLLRKIAENIFAHEQAMKLSFGKHLVRTADDVILEITKSPVQDDFYLMRLV